MFNQRQWQYMVGVCLAVIALAAVWLLAAPAQAQLGNNAIPVRCSPATQDGIISGAAFFRCVAADGTAFGNNGQAVPNGRYLLVTDITLTPDRLTTADTPPQNHLTGCCP